LVHALSYHGGPSPVTAGDGPAGRLAFTGRPCWNGRRTPFNEALVPTLFRFLVVIAVLAGLAYAAMFALATLVEPEPREMTTTIPASRLPSR
jgi:hypothetical protein